MNTEQLNALKERAYKTAVAHGFHEEERLDAYWLGLVMSEMGEAINADQKGMHADMESFEEHMANGYSFNDAFYLYIKDSLEDELADIVIRLLDFAGLRGYRLDIDSIGHVVSYHVLAGFEGHKLPGTLVSLVRLLIDAVNENQLDEYVGIVICVLSDCFAEMTGSDKGLWWFVEQKMKFNEMRPKLNGKKY